MNLDIYTEEMRKSIWDKAFFMDKIIGAKIVIDFGCADGAMIDMLAPLFPSIMFIGYDSNQILIEKANNTITYPNVKFFHKNEFWNMIYYIKDSECSDRITINFSSVLHEVFSETEDDSLYVVKALIEELQPRYISIRDMYFDYSKNIVTEAIRDNIFANIHPDPNLLDEFKKEHGTVAIWRNMIHFLMKYQWKDNGWEEEMREDYFSWRINDVLKLIDNYHVSFESHYQLPYYTEVVWKGLPISPDIHTHAQFVLRRDD